MGWKIFTAALLYGFYDVVTAGALAPILFFSCCALTYSAIKPKRLR